MHRGATGGETSVADARGLLVEALAILDELQVLEVAATVSGAIDRLDRLVPLRAE